MTRTILFLLLSFSPSHFEKDISKISNDGILQIKKFEGYSEIPYKCPASVVAIGYGSTTYEDGKPVSLSDPPITKKAANVLFLKKIRKLEKQVNRLLKTNISQNQFDALVSLTYNIGIGSFKKSNLLKLVNLNPNDPEIAVEFLKWTKVKGKVQKGLENRRIVEIDLYFR